MPPSEQPPRRDLTKGGTISAILVLAVPMIAGNLLRTTYTLVDLRFVSRLGKEAVAAVIMSGQLLFLLGTVFIGVGAAATAMVSRAIGAKEQARANHAAAQTLLLTFILAILAATAGWFLAPELLMLLKAPEETVLGLATTYLRTMFCGLLAMFSLFVGAGILRGAGDAVTPLIISALGTVLNIVLDPLLIFGWWWFPAMGVKGAALASVTAQYTAFLVGMLVLASGKVRVRLTIRAFRPDPGVIWSAVRIGVPSSFRMSLRAVMGVYFMRVVAFFGTSAIAAYGVAMRLQSVGFMPTFGIAAASATLVGQNLGAEQPDRAQKSALISTALAVGIMGSIALLAYILAPELVSFFAKDETSEVVSLGTRFIRISVIGHVFAAVSIVLSRAVSGAGDTVPPLIFNLLVLWGLQVPLAHYLAYHTRLEAAGVWWANVIAAMTLAACSTAYFLYGRWKRIKIWHKPDAVTPTTNSVMENSG